MEKKVIFSGFQPTGNLHIGNYIGAIKPRVKMQDEGENIFFIVDLHAITIPQDPKALTENTLDIAAFLLASGVDPEKSIIFIQSQNPDHGNLTWILNCFLSMGQLNRMTQYKDKAEGKDFVSVGLFDYPALMASDILLYDSTHVPVGEDQKQHVELTRDVAERFNSRFGQTFILPEPVIPNVGARVMSLTDPTKKMSKSDTNPDSRIHLMDTEDEVQRKLSQSVTDSDSEVRYDRENKPGISNLIEIYSELTNLSIGKVEENFRGKGYGEFKKAVGEKVIEELKPLQKKFKDLKESKELSEVLRKGAERAKEISGKKLKEVYNKIGFVSF